MNIDQSINALHSINADFNKIPSRIYDSFHNPETKEGLENTMTDMLVGENSFTANVKAIRTMNTVEDILLEELRNEG
jgi:hypothetical protein